MGDEREFQIKITGDASSLVSAAGQSAQSLGQVKDGATAAGQAAVQAGDKTGQANEDASKKVEKHVISHRDLHRAIHAVSEEVPFLGTAMQFSLGVGAGAVGVLVMALHALSSWLEKIKERYKDAAQAATASWRAQQAQAAAARDSAEDYATALKHILENTDALKTSEEKELAVLNAIEAARKKILEAQEAAEMAAAKGDKTAEAEVAARYKRKKSDEDLAAEEDAINQKKGFLAREKQKAVEDYDLLAAAEAAKERGPGGIAEGAEAEHALPKLKAAVDTAKEDADRAALLFKEHPQGIGSPGGDVPEISAAFLAEDAAKKQAAYKVAQAAEAAAMAAIDKPKQEAKRLEEEAQRTAAEAKKSHDQAVARQAEIDKDQAVHDINRKSASEVNRIETERELQAAGFKKNSVRGKTLLGDITAEEARAHGETMTGHQAAGIQQLVGALKAAGNNQQQINKIIQDMMDLHMSHTQKLQELANGLNLVKKQVKNASNDGT